MAKVENISFAENFPISFKELEEEAEKVMGAGGFGYVQSGAGGEETLKKNIESFAKYSIVPRMLRDVSVPDISVNLFGKTYPYPVFLAPIGMQRLEHSEGELASARAAASFGIPFIQSTVSSYSIEEVANATGTSPKWFQLYWSNYEDAAFSMVRRAEESGYEAIVLTVDTVMMGWREADLRNNFSPLKLGYGKANYESDPVFMATLHDGDVVQGILDNIHHPTLSWEHIARLKEKTSLPILLKGILHPEDARLAVEKGIDGIIVSNHGGRQLDGVIAAIDALGPVVKEVKGRIPVLLDSGIRRGSDVVKALALGADAVCLGRPYVYGLAIGGQAGVEKVLANFIEETKVSLSLAGFGSLKEMAGLQLIR